MFTLTVLKLLLIEGRSVLRPAQRVPGSDRVNKIFKSNLKLCTVTSTKDSHQIAKNWISFAET